MKNATTVESREEIERVLVLGLAPITNNRSALLALGFARAFPDAVSGYEPTVWERANGRPQGSKRASGRERAYLIA